MRPAATRCVAPRCMVRAGKRTKEVRGVGVGLITPLLPLPLSSQLSSLPLPTVRESGVVPCCVSGGVLPLVYPLDLILTVVGGT